VSRSDNTDGWDAVVIGSGLGGALAAQRLSEAGARVLVLERGRWPHRDEGDWSPRAILSDLRYRGKTPLSVRQLGDRPAGVDHGGPSLAVLLGQESGDRHVGEVGISVKGLAVRHGKLQGLDDGVDVGRGVVAHGS